MESNRTLNRQSNTLLNKENLLMKDFIRFFLLNQNINI